MTGPQAHGTEPGGVAPRPRPEIPAHPDEATGHRDEPATHPNEPTTHPNEPTTHPDEATAHRDGAAVHRFIERFATVLALSGIPRMPARVLAVFLTSDASRLTATDIARTLQISPAAVSGAVRYLGDVGLISREAQPGSRRYWYRMPDNMWHEVVKLRDQLMRRWADVMHEGLEILGPATPAGGRAGRVAHVHRVRAERTAHGAHPLGGVQGSARAAAARAGRRGPLTAVR